MCKGLLKKKNVLQGMAVIICLLSVMAQQVNAARVEVAEELLVDLRSEDLAPGPVTEWPNRGTLGGSFIPGNDNLPNVETAWGEGLDVYPYEGHETYTNMPALEKWWYLVYTYDGGTCRLYVNGEPAGEKSMVLGTKSGSVIRIACQSASLNEAHSGRRLNGALAQVRIHDGVLTPEQIQTNAQIRIQTSGEVSNPSPKNDDPDVPLRDLILSWEPGEYPGTHTVYFSEDMNAVESGIAEAVPDIDVNSYVPGPLNYETTYYWRVAEVNDSPDKTVYEGSVWSFTTEPYALPIPAQAISATASSQSPDQGPEKTVDRSGLDVNDMHSTVGTDMWLSEASEPNSAWIQYEFDIPYKLHQMLVWNYNGESFLTGSGMKDVTVEYSSEGSNWMLLDNVTEFQQAPGTNDYASDIVVDFDVAAVKFVKITATSNWLAFSPRFGLSEVQFLQIPVSASKPSPDDGATEVAIDVSLNWKAGREAAEHKVYLSADAQSVENSTVPVETVLETRYGPLSLDLGQTYYWRVDEVNSAETITTWQGGVWSFTTSESIVVDDFESYNDIEAGEEGSNLVYNTWTDGFDNPAINGSTIGYFEAFQPTMETDIVHGGRQSVPVFYDNTSATLSEVTVSTNDLAIGSDWTKGSPEMLVLWIYGDPNNPATERMYVKVNTTKVNYEGSLAQEDWQQFSIDLASLGINLSNVTSITIGFERIGATGGSGMIFIDDILLVALLE